MRPEQPSGTVTLVFTDIEGSTRLLEELGTDGYRGALAEHRRVVREACARHEGYEVDFEGDAFFYAFSSAQQAVSAVAEAMAGLAGGPIRIRVGVHTGEPALDPPKYVGLDVHRAARIMSSAHGGQVLVSASTAALTGSEGLVDLGEHRFKDLGAPERVYQLGDGEFPPIRTLYRSNLPVPATMFLGREREVGEVVDLLQREGSRLATLTGPGGTGKTRLALQAAAEASDRYPDGVFWVPLASLRDAGLMLSSVAQALQVGDEVGRALVDTLASRLSGKRLLVLLDNVEHLMPDAALHVAALRDACPTLMLLATSRERLRVSGERTYAVSSLAPGEAEELFLERAGSAGVELQSTPAVRELCARLDHLPLALELAAARSVVFSPEQLLARLGERLDLLRGERDADPRQATLRATIEWSYDLLADEERELFRRFSVFVGGCTYDAAEHVARADPDTLQSLLDKSLLRRREAELDSRYWMLETVYQYAVEQLERSETTVAIRMRHARYYADRLAALQPLVREYDPRAMHDARDEIANARAGLATAFELAEPGIAGAYLWGLWVTWLFLGLNREAVEAAVRYLAMDRSSSPEPEHFWGRLGASEILRFSGLLDEAASLKRELLDVLATDSDLSFHGMGGRSKLAPLLTDLASIELELGDLDSAREHAARGLEVRRNLGREWGIAHALAVVATLAVADGDLQGARLMQLEALGHWAAESSVEVVGPRLEIAAIDLLLGNVRSASLFLTDAMSSPLLDEDVGFAEFAIRVGAAAVAALGAHREAARLIGAADALREQTGMSISRHEAERHRATATLVVDALGEESFARARSDGMSLDSRQALEFVRTTLALAGSR